MATAKHKQTKEVRYGVKESDYNSDPDWETFPELGKIRIFTKEKPETQEDSQQWLLVYQQMCQDAIDKLRAKGLISPVEETL